MPVTTRTETYRGHELQVDAWPVGKWWAWSYLVDGVQLGQSVAKLSTAEAALERAMNAAKARVDEG